MLGPGHWAVRGRVERFIEPSLLLLLRERPRHGYELLEEVPGLVGEHGSVDLGNLYRILRSLEVEGIVSSSWRSDLPGQPRRTYELTAAGRRLLDQWAEALSRTQTVIAGFLRRYEAKGEPSS